ncbi:hypothetical protein Tco_1409399 [Tanacetum coccineum]
MGFERKCLFISLFSKLILVRIFSSLKDDLQQDFQLLFYLELQMSNSLELDDHAWSCLSILSGQKRYLMAIMAIIVAPSKMRIQDGWWKLLEFNLGRMSTLRSDKVRDQLQMKFDHLLEQKRIASSIQEKITVPNGVRFGAASRKLFGSKYGVGDCHTAIHVECDGLLANRRGLGVWFKSNNYDVSWKLELSQHRNGTSLAIPIGSVIERSASSNVMQVGVSSGRARSFQTE